MKIVLLTVSQAVIQSLDLPAVPQPGNLVKIVGASWQVAQASGTVFHPPLEEGAESVITVVVTPYTEP